MVMSVMGTPTYSSEHDVFVGNSRVSIEQPLICVDGYILACRFDGVCCSPTFGISMEDLLCTVRTELSAQLKTTEPTSICNSPPKSPRRVNSIPHPLTYSRRQFFRQSSRDRKSEGEDLIGVSYDHIEHSSRNSFILPISNQKTSSESFHAKRTNEDIVLKDFNENMLEKTDMKKQLELQPQIEWVKDHCSDYINTETVTTCAELQALLNILMKMSTAALVTLKIVNTKEITVTFQFMENFKRNYMFVKVNPGYAILMKTF